MSKVQIQIVATNHQRFLKRLFESLREQTFRDFSVILVDNASKDGSADFVRANFPEVMTLKNTNNLGTTGAHNQAFRLAMSKWPEASWAAHYVLLLGPDVVLAPTFLAELVRVADARPEAGEFGGKVMKLFDAAGEDRELEQFDESHMLDSTGLVMLPGSKVFERGDGELDSNQYEAGELFGFSGACVLLRASALADVREGEDVFDASFFNYHEDADLAWRLQRAGWSAHFVPTAVAYHYRGWFKAKKASWFSGLRERFTASRQTSFYSYRNHLLVLTKNLRFWEFMSSVHRIVPREIARFVVLLVLAPSVCLRALGSYFALLPQTLRKRSRILRRVIE